MTAGFGAGWTARQIMSSRRIRVGTQRIDTRIGRICQNSASEAVLQWLLSKPPKTWWTRAHVVRGTGRTEASVDWALLFLSRTGRIRSTDDSRCVRYRLYRANR